MKEARQEAEAADRSLTSQIEHWARLGRKVESVLRHEEVLALKRSSGGPLAPPTRRALLAALRRIAGEGIRPDLGASLKQGRTVYQDAGDDRIERIERDGRRTIGRFVGRSFVPDEPRRARRRR